MPLYIFHLFNPYGVSAALEAHELPDGAATFAKAGELLDEHLGSDHVEVWQGERPILARHREQPVIRPIDEVAPPRFMRVAGPAPRIVEA